MADAVENIEDESTDQPLPEFLQEIEDEMTAFLVTAGLDPDAPMSLTDRERMIDFQLERMAGLHWRARMNEDLAERRKADIQTWLDNENHILERQCARLEAMILENMPGTLEAFQETFAVKTKSRKLPHGKVGFKASQDTVDIDDQEKAVEWAKANGVEVKVETTLLKTPAKKYIAETGDMPDPETDGLRFVPGSERRYVAPNAD